MQMYFLFENDSSGNFFTVADNFCRNLFPWKS